MRILNRHLLVALVVPTLAVGCGDSNPAAPAHDDDHDGALATTLTLALRTAVDAPAVIYDLQADWSDVSNPNGVWSLNGGNSNLVPVADLSTTGIDEWDIPQPGFTGQPIFGDITPVWFRSTIPLANGNPDFQPGDIVTHTSRPDVPNSNVTWTSDLDGLIDIVGSVWATRELGRSNDWFVYLNDQLLTSGTVSSGDPFDRANPFPLDAGSGGPGPLKNVPVTLDDVVKLEFQQLYGFGEDYVGVNLTITMASPTTKDDCKNGGWEQYGFRNQGQCVRFIETGKDSR